MNEAELRAACDENFVAAFRRLVPHATSERAGAQSFGTAVAVVSGAPGSFFNPVLVAGSRAEPADVAAAVAWVRARGAEPSIQARADLFPAVEVTGRSLGLEPEAWTMPGMALHPIPTAIPGPPTELETVVVETESEIDAWFAAAGEGMRKVFRTTFARDDNVRLVVGLVGGTPVCQAAAIVSPTAVGIYAVGTIEAARRRGYGLAVTWAAIAAGREAWARDAAILQSSEMGERVYRSMGFREVCRYVISVPPRKPGAAAAAE